MAKPRSPARSPKVPKAPKAPGARSPGRPPKAPEARAVVPPVTGVRIPADLLVDLDAEVTRANAALAAQGATTNRSAVIVLLLREGLAARAKRVKP